MPNTWIYDDAGNSRLVDLPEGAKAPEGWAFSPADFGVELKPDADASPPSQYVPSAAPPTGSEAVAPQPEDPRILALWARVGALEQALARVDETLKEVLFTLAGASDKAEPPVDVEASNPDDVTLTDVLAAMSRDDLEAEASKLDMRVDKRWNDKTLREQIIAKLASDAGE